MELKRISAEEARKMSDEVEIALTRIYKFIKEQARENARSLFYNIMDPSKTAVSAIQKDLTEQGYTVTVNDNDDCVELLIKW